MQLVGMLRHGTCLATRRWLGDLCDGDLAPPDECLVRRHLAGCRRCRRAMTNLEATIADLESELRDLERQLAHLPPDADVLALTTHYQGLKEILDGQMGAWAELGEKLEGLRARQGVSS